MPGLSLFVDVDAPAQETWQAVVDWAAQGEWMLGTRVRPVSLDGSAVGARLEAFSGIGRVGLLEPMEITVWQPPRACHVVHLGRVVRGTGAFEVEPRGDGRSRFRWREDLELPLGLVGRVGWLLVRPLFAWGVQHSLRRFARHVAARTRTLPT
jgi:hypothetical protein